ncbi:MAG: hypothetical protein U5R06_22110 [candidate division KSB1 bacterium]|nr:hypothetical protein [candidate division KSB1 bacterium]
MKEAPFNQWLAAGVLSILCIGFGLFAVGVPLKLFIYPVLSANGMALPEFLGLYQPVLLTLLFGIVFLLGIIVFVLLKKIRIDNIYLGGMSPVENLGSPEPHFTTKSAPCGR